MRGFAPSTPSRDIVPAPKAGNGYVYLTSIIPVNKATRRNFFTKED